MRIDLFVKSFLLLFVLCISNDAYAGSLEDGVAAYTKGDFSTAMRLFRPLAESGNRAGLGNLDSRLSGFSA